MVISALPLMALLSKLRDSSTGFNASLASVVSYYSIAPFTIDFPDTVFSTPTKNFLLGQFNPDEIEQSGITVLNRMVMFAFQSTNQNFEKMRDFSGLVQVGLDTQIGWIGGNVSRTNMESLSLAVEDAIAQVVQPYMAQNWGAGVVYNGGFTCQRGPVEPSGQGNFRQIVASRFAFQIDVGG